MNAPTPKISTDPTTGDLIVDHSPALPAVPEQSGDHFDNLVSDIAPDALDALCNSLTEQVAQDDSGREAFLEMMAKHIELLGISPDDDPSNLDYEDADTSTSTLMLRAFLTYQSKTTAAIIPQPHKVYRAKPAKDLEEIEDLKERQREKTRMDGVIKRVEDFYADYLFFRDQTYQEDTDRIVWDSGLHGMGIRKIYNDHSRERNKTRVEWVPVQNMIFSYDARSTNSGRVTQKIAMSTSDIIRMIKAGQYMSDDLVTQISNDGAVDALTEVQDKVSGLTAPTGTGSSHPVYEIYTDLFLNADPHPLGMARPYVVTVHQPSHRIISIRRNWQPGDPEEKRIEAFVAYIHSPGTRSTQGLGLGQLMGRTTETIRDGQRDALDSGRLQNTPWGWKLAGMSIRNSTERIVPGTLLDIDSPTDDVRKAVQMGQFTGPSPGLIQLIDALKSDGRELGGIATMDFSNFMKSGVPVAPALAALEEGSEFQTSVHRRLYDAHEMEARLVHERMQEVQGGSPVVYGSRALQKGDLIDVELLPAMKPGFVSKQKSIMEAAALKEASQAAPGVLDDRKVTLEYVRALGREDIEDFLLPNPDEAPPPPPVDAVTEYGLALRGQPLMAHMHQNHKAHIDAHNSQLRMIEASGLPVADGERAMAALAAHVVEHHAQMMVVDIASRLGVDPGTFQEGMPPEMEAMVAGGIAEATAAVEAERRPAEPTEESKVAVEQAKGQIRLTEAQMKQRHEAQQAELDRQHERELAQLKEDAETARHDADDDTAVEIAKMKLEDTGSKTIRNVAGASGG